MCHSLALGPLSAASVGARLGCSARAATQRLMRCAALGLVARSQTGNGRLHSRMARRGRLSGRDSGRGERTPGK